MTINLSLPKLLLDRVQVEHRIEQGKIAMDAAPPRNKTSTIFTKISAGIGGMLGVLWGLFTYLFPDPSVFGLNVEFINWKTLISVVATLTLLAALSISVLACKLPNVLKVGVWLSMAMILCAVFFRLGGEYAKPSFEFARAQKLTVVNESTNVFGKRAETIDDVRLELLDCDQNGQALTCTLELTNKGADREFRFLNPVSLFEETGGALSLTQLRVGEAKYDRWDNFQLIRSVPTRVTFTFEAAKGRVKLSPALKLLFKDRESKENVLKFNDVKVN